MKIDEDVAGQVGEGEGEGRGGGGRGVPHPRVSREHDKERQADGSVPARTRPAGTKAPAGHDPRTCHQYPHGYLLKGSTTDPTGSVA